jgi:hypothetical protein
MGHENNQEVVVLALIDKQEVVVEKFPLLNIISDILKIND